MIITNLVLTDQRIPNTPATPQQLSRRQACKVIGAGAIAALGALSLGTLSGCSPRDLQEAFDDDPNSQPGMAADTVVRNYPVQLKLYADAHLQQHFASVNKDANGRPLGQLEDWIMRYKSGIRAGVSIEVQYVTTEEILNLSQQGFPDGDGLLCLEPTMNEAIKSREADAGPGLLYVRKIYDAKDGVIMVRAAGSEVVLPPAATLSGLPSKAGEAKITRWQQLPKFAGKIALPPQTELSGRGANAFLAAEDIYLDGIESPLGGLVDGHLADNVANKFVVYPSQDAAMAAIISGECQLGFTLSWSLNRSSDQHYTGIEFAADRDASGNMSSNTGGSSLPVYVGTNLMRSPEGAVMRDFFAWVYELKL